MESFQKRAIEYHRKDFEENAFISSHVLRVLPKKTRTEIGKIHDVKKKVKRFIGAFKNEEDGFDRFLEGLRYERQNEYLVRKIQKKAAENLKSELGKRPNNPPKEKQIQISQKEFAEISEAVIGKRQISPEEANIESFGIMIDELKDCRKYLTGKEDKASERSSLSTLIKNRYQNQQKELEKIKRKKQMEIDLLNRQLDNERGKNQTLQEENKKLTVQNERLIKEQSDSLRRRELLVPLDDVTNITAQTLIILNGRQEVNVDASTTNADASNILES